MIESVEGAEIRLRHAVSACRDRKACPPRGCRLHKMTAMTQRQDTFAKITSDVLNSLRAGFGWLPERNSGLGSEPFCVLDRPLVLYNTDFMSRPHANEN